MKCTMMFALFAAILVVVSALPFDHTVRRPPPRGGVSFPGYGSFNRRGRRSPYDARIKVDQPVGKDPTYQIDVNQPIYEGKNGHIDVYGSASRGGNGRDHADAGIRGEITWGNGQGGLTDDDIDRFRKEAKIN